MVSFSCSCCGDVIKKPKTLSHSQQCGGGNANAITFSCIDCMQTFTVSTIKSHTSCITEVDKYQGKWLQQKQTDGHHYKSSNSGDGKNGSRSTIIRPKRPQMTFSSSDEDSSDDNNAKKNIKDNLHIIRNKSKSSNVNDDDNELKKGKDESVLKIDKNDDNSSSKARFVDDKETQNKPGSKRQREKREENNEKKEIGNNNHKNADKDNSSIVFFRCDILLGDKSFVFKMIKEIEGEIKNKSGDNSENRDIGKEVAKELVTRYHKRISKAMMSSVVSQFLPIESSGNKL